MDGFVADSMRSDWRFLGQGGVRAWAQAELSAEGYANFVMGWANGERWASRKAEAFSAAAAAAGVRETGGR